MGDLLVYKASAGSGKTFTLIRTFLSWSLTGQPNTQFKRILALTFTIKAATEMRERLLKALEEIKALMPESVANDKMAMYLMQDLNIDFETLQSRAARMQHAVLQDYGDLNIGTIDQFNHRLIRAFSRDLALPNDWQVETNDAELFAEATAGVIAQVGLDDHITTHLLNYLTYIVENDKKESLANSLTNLKNLVLADDSRQAMAYLAGLEPEAYLAMQEKLRKLWRAIQTELRETSQKVIDLLDSAGISAGDLRGKEKSGIYTWHQKIARSRFLPDGLKISGNAEAARAGDWVAKAEAKKVMPKLDPILAELAPLHEKTCDLIEKQLSKYLLLRKIDQSFSLTAILANLNAEFQRILTESKIQTISQFNGIIARTLLEEPAAFIYERYGTRFDHILIDEFQDTSALQWYNLLPLIEEGLARGKSSMLVGDAKQSIYRWRGGRAEQLIALPDLHDAPDYLSPAIFGTVERAFHLETLDTNHRSQLNIVTFNNLFFEAISAELAQSPLYSQEYNGDKLRQLPRSTEVAGYIDIRTKGKIEKDERFDTLLEQIAHCRNSGLEYGEMCVLYRTNAAGMAIAEALSQSEIPISSTESFYLESNGKVMLLLNMMRSLTRSPSNIAKVGALRALAEMHGIPYQPDKYVEVGQLNLQKFLTENQLPPMPKAWKGLSAFELAQELIRTYLPQDTDPYIPAFLASIAEEVGYGGSLARFINWWDGKEAKNRPRYPNSSTTDSVQLMTIHKSKGLQFQAVFVAELSWQVYKWGDAWVPLEIPELPELKYGAISVVNDLKPALAAYVAEEELAMLFDNINLVYVAFTRAVQALYISYSAGNADRVSSKIHGIFTGLIPKLTEAFEPAKIEHADKELVMHLGHLNPARQDGESRYALSDRPKLAHSVLNEIELGRTQSKLGLLGDIIHQLAPWVYHTKRWERNLAKLARAHSLEADELSDIRKTLEDLRQNDWYRALLQSGQCLVERDLIWQEAIMRPDLLVETETEITVIDFKTGKPKLEHRDQIKSYAAALRHISQKSVRANLIYFDPVQIVPVDNYEAAKQGDLFA